jgi:hypothetical protein
MKISAFADDEVGLLAIPRGVTSWHFAVGRETKPAGRRPYIAVLC